MKFATPSLALILSSLATTPALASDPAIVPVQLVLEGDTVTGVGVITGIDKLAVNGVGGWLVEVNTDNVDTSIDRVVLGPLGLSYQEGQALALPAGASLAGFSPLQALTLNDAGQSGWTLFLGVAPDHSAIYRNVDLVLVEGALSGAAGFSAGTPYTFFHQTRINNTDQILVRTTVDDPAIASSADMALVVFQLDGLGALASETIVAKEGDILPGQAFAAASVGGGAHNLSYNDAGDVMYVVETVDPNPTADGAIYLNSTVLAQEGAPSPVTGRNWLFLSALGSSTPFDLSNNGLHTLLRGQLTGSSTDDQLVALDGAKFVQEGDSPSDISPFLLTGFGAGALRVTDGGDVVWIGDWDDPDTTRDVGLFYNKQLLVQEGVTTVGGVLVDSIWIGMHNFAVSADGRYILFEASLTGGLNGAFLIDRGPWQDLGGADAGTAGPMRLLGSGSLEGNSAVSLTVERALPNARATLVLGASLSNTPFNGGVLVPSVDSIIPGLTTDASGELFVTGRWPAGVPSGFTIYAQVFVTDSGAVGGLAGSNGVVGTAP